MSKISSVPNIFSVYMFFCVTIIMCQTHCIVFLISDISVVRRNASRVETVPVMRFAVGLLRSHMDAVHTDLIKTVTFCLTTPYIQFYFIVSVPKCMC
jgi:hypothetical protein